MSQRIAEEDDWDDENRDDDEPTVDCPYCQKPIPEDTPHCPYCGNYISDEDAPSQKKPLWIIVAAILCLMVVAMWLFL